MPDDDVFSRVILDAEYEGIKFHVDSEDAEFGHDGIEHMAYRRPGADIEPTGAKPRRGSLSCLFFNGISTGLFPDRLQQLTNAILEKPIGNLVHPVEGIMQAFMKTGHRTVSAQERDGCRLKLEWVEHKASASGIAGGKDASSAVNTPEAATQQAVEADAAMTAVAPGGGFFAVTSLIALELDRLESQFTRVSEIEASLRRMVQAVTTNITLPLFAGVEAYEAIIALEALRSSVVRLRARYLPDASKIRQYVVPVQMSVWAIALQVYGDAGLGDLILRNNAIPDVLFVAPGSVLSILPLV